MEVPNYKSARIVPKHKIQNTDKLQISSCKSQTAHPKRVRHFAIIGICLSFVIWILVLPRHSTAAVPASNPSSRIGALFSKLADRDPGVRDQARSDLMGLSRADLPLLRKYVQEHRPLAPSQAAALREIVVQVFMAGESYAANNAHGFLGVTLSEGGIGLPAAPEAVDPSAPPPIGVIVTDRLPGLCAYRMLSNGDVIIGIAEHPETPIRSVDALRSAISDCQGGQTIHLEVFRGGRVVNLPVTLSPRPIEVELNPSNPDFFPRERQRRADIADDYWQREFAPLVDNGVS